MNPCRIKNMNVLLPLLQSQKTNHGATEHAQLTTILSDIKIKTLNALKKIAQTPSLIGGKPILFSHYKQDYILITQKTISNSLYFIVFRYKISFFVTDGTYNLEFMLFEKRGAELIGKSAETLRKQYDITQTPPEVILLINHKFTFIVKVLYKSINALEPSFEVVLIKERFGKQPAPPMSQLYKSPAVAPSSTVFAAHEDLPLVLPIGSKNIQGQVKV